MNKLLFVTSLFCASLMMGQLDAEVINETLLKHQDNSKFDSIAQVLGYKGGDKVRVLSMFTINEQGDVVDVIARAPHAIFEKEALRIINKLPKMDPPMADGTATSARFSLPITFIIQTEEEQKKSAKKKKRKKKSKA